MNHVSVFLSCKLPNPYFKSQTRECLVRPAPKINIPENLLKKVNEFEISIKIMITNHEYKYLALICFINDGYLEFKNDSLINQRRFFNISAKLNFDTQTVLLNILSENNLNKIINFDKFMAKYEYIHHLL